MSLITTLVILDTTLQLLERQVIIRERLTETRNELRQMQAEGREPSEAEWEALNKRIADAGITLDARAEDARKALVQ